MTAILNTNYLIAEAAIAVIVGALWALFAGLQAACGAVFTHWRPLALVAGLVGAVALCVAVPALPVGLGITALFGWATYPGGAK